MAAKLTFAPLAFLAFLFVCTAPVTRAAAAPAAISSMAMLADDSGLWTVDQAKALDTEGRFRPLPENQVRLGYTRSDYWFRIDIQGGDTSDWMALEFVNPRLGEVTLFTPTREGNYRSKSVGVRIPFWNREMPGLSPAFAVRIPENQTRTYYVCVKNFGSLRFDVGLWSLSEHNQRANYLLAGVLLIAGALLVLGLYNFCIYVHLRQAGYLWIALFLLSCTVWQMASSGTANMFLWPNAPEWSRHALLITGAITLLLGTVMANVLLDTKSLAPRMGMVNLAVGLVSATGALLSLFDNTMALYLTLMGGLLVPVIVTGLAVYAIRQGAEAGGSFLRSWGIAVVGCVVTNLIGPGYLPANWFTIHFMDIALLGACLGWSFSLTGRLKVNEHHQRLLLEEKVQHRTAELQSALDAVKTLHGLLPICSCCKKIRNDDGYWQHVETYLQEHTEADFSHGICPDCAHDHYPDYFPRPRDDQRTEAKEEPGASHMIE